MDCVYGVIENAGYDGMHVVGIYSTMERANEVANVFNNSDNFTCGGTSFEVVKYDLDKLTVIAKDMIARELLFVKDQVKILESLL